ncbi:MAG: DMT family transporter [Methylococcales bacterium]|nr:DMT family transporter [Methylococcales bacterium]
MVVGEPQQATSWLGDVCAFISAANIAAAFVLTRKNKQINMVPAIAASGLVSALIALPFAHWTALSADTILIIILMGLVITVAFGLITIGPRYISATEVSLIMPLETVGGIALAWMFLNEVPSRQSLWGALIILLSLMLHGMLSVRTKH